MADVEDIDLTGTRVLVTGGTSGLAVLGTGFSEWLHSRNA